MRQKLSECGESWRIADRHANYYRLSLPTSKSWHLSREVLSAQHGVLPISQMLELGCSGVLHLNRFERGLALLQHLPLLFLEEASPQ